MKENQESVEQLERQLRNKPNEKMHGLSHKEKIINEIRTANRLKMICPELTLTTLRESVMV
jgi:t-SNARE complex subunit (syntaxin)